MTLTDIRPSPAGGFAAHLKDATESAHRDAEGSRFVAALLRGELHPRAHHDLLAQTHAVYAVLERAAQAQVDHPVAGRFVTDALTRLPALEADLDHLAGPDWRQQRTLLPSTCAYVARLQQVAFDWPAGFVAHHYIRYLGDLSGGQIIRRMLERAYGLSTEGLAFYTFTHVPKPKIFKGWYRGLLDTAGWDADEQHRVVEEVRAAYGLNRALFDDLERSLPDYRR